MSTAVLDKPDVVDSDLSDVEHYYCDCSENVSLCGWDISDEPLEEYKDPDEDTCSMCVYMLDLPCPRCGD